MDDEQDKKAEEISKMSYVDFERGMREDRFIKSPDYSPKIRGQIDSAAAKKKYRAKQFNGKKTTKEMAKNTTVHVDADAAKRKYGEKKYTNHIADVDHSYSIKEMYEDTRYNPFIDNRSRRNAVNNEHNLKLVNAKTNRSKGQKSNIQIVRKSNDLITEKEAAILAQIEGKVSTHIKLVPDTLKGMHDTGAKSAKSAAELEVAISTAKHLDKVRKGEEDVGEAVTNIAVDTAKTASMAYVSSIGMKATDAAIMKITSNSAANFINAGGSAKIFIVVKETGTSMIKYLNGDITEAQLVDELGEKGSGLAASFFVGAEGASIGAIIGTFVGGPVGTAVGAGVGELVGNMVGYIIGTQCYRTIQEYSSKFAIDSEEYRRLEKMYNDLAEQIKAYRIALEATFQELHYQQQKEISEAFQEMMDGILNNDTDRINHSLQRVCIQYGVEVEFDNCDDFDDFMNDTSRKAVIGNRRKNGNIVLSK